MLIQDLHVINAVKPCLPHGVWITFYKSDGTALTHLLAFLRNHLRLQSKRPVPLEKTPLAQNGRRSVTVCELIASLEKFEASAEELAHDVHIGFRDEHRDVFLAYQNEVGKLRQSMYDSTEQSSIDFANNLWEFCNEVQIRYFPKVFH